MKRIDFWFSIGSTYTYLTVMRIDEVTRRSGVTVDWRPFSVRALMQEMNNIPFVGKPVKERYMWRDIERRAKRYGLPILLPVSYPLEDFDLANRVAVVARQEGWCADYVRTSYRLWFQQGLPAGGARNLERGLAELGQSEDRVRELAASDAVGSAYRDATAEARSLGIFGAPSFVVDDQELFWGDDRLEDAIDRAVQPAGDER